MPHSTPRRPKAVVSTEPAKPFAATEARERLLWQFSSPGLGATESLVAAVSSHDGSEAYSSWDNPTTTNSARLSEDDWHAIATALVDRMNENPEALDSLAEALSDKWREHQLDPREHQLPKASRCALTRRALHRYYIRHENVMASHPPTTQSHQQALQAALTARRPQSFS